MAASVPPSSARKVARSDSASQSTIWPMNATSTISRIAMVAVSVDIRASGFHTGRE